VRSFRLLTPDEAGVEVDAEVVLLDTGRDIAVLRSAADLAGSLTPAAPEAGEVGRIVTAAQPGELRTKRVVVDDITRVRVDGGGERLALALAAEVRPGDSGAPVLDLDDAFLGMVFAAVDD